MYLFQTIIHEELKKNGNVRLEDPRGYLKKCQRQ